MKTEYRELLLRLARTAIEHYLKYDKKYVPRDIPDDLQVYRASFVTLTIDNELRGCIGHLESVQPLYMDVIENAIAAAFKDPRFPPLTEDEFVTVKIEVSALSRPETVTFNSKDELLESLASKPGVIIQKNGMSATFLPQVWEQLTEPEDFLGHLCQKAGLAADEWERDVHVQTYTVEAFKED